MKNSETKDFIAYEYLSLNVNTEKEPLYIDCYENFGWTLINNTGLVDKEDYYINNYSYNNTINLKFKRDRKIKNKNQLLYLQRKLESSLKEIDKLEKEPYSKGFTYSMAIGMIVSLIIIAMGIYMIINIQKDIDKDYKINKSIPI